MRPSRICQNRQLRFLLPTRQYLVVPGLAPAREQDSRQKGPRVLDPVHPRLQSPHRSLPCSPPPDEELADILDRLDLL